jgi:hypothetical protein
MLLTKCIANHMQTRSGSLYSRVSWICHAVNFRRRTSAASGAIIVCRSPLIHFVLPPLQQQLVTGAANTLCHLVVVRCHQIPPIIHVKREDARARARTHLQMPPTCRDAVLTWCVPMQLSNSSGQHDDVASAPQQVDDVTAVESSPSTDDLRWPTMADDGTPTDRRRSEEADGPP